MQSNGTLQSPIWESANLSTSPLPETPSVDLVHFWESKESELLSCRSINAQTSDPIPNIFIDNCLVTTNDNHMHSPTKLMKLLMFDGVSFEGS